MNLTQKIFALQRKFRQYQFNNLITRIFVKCYNIYRGQYWVYYILPMMIPLPSKLKSIFADTSSLNKVQNPNRDLLKLNKNGSLHSHIQNTNDSSQLYAITANLNQMNRNQYIEGEQLEVKTSFPYARRQIFQMFKQKHIPHEKAFHLQECKLFLKQKLQQMQGYGYDFKYKQWTFKPAKKSGKPFWKEMRRKVYVRNQCHYCKQKGKFKRWTSILGVAEIRFKIMDLIKFLEMFPKFQLKTKSPKEQAQNMKYKKIVQWELKFYRMKCVTCGNWGQISLYKKQLEALSLSFCWIISQILAGAQQPKRHKDDRHKNQEDVHKHLQKFCQACQLGKCFNISKHEEGKISN